MFFHCANTWKSEFKTSSSDFILLTSFTDLTCCTRRPCDCSSVTPPGVNFLFQCFSLDTFGEKKQTLDLFDVVFWTLCSCSLFFTVLRFNLHIFVVYWLLRTHTLVHDGMHTSPPPPTAVVPVKHKLGKVPALFFLKSGWEAVWPFLVCIWF